MGQKFSNFVVMEAVNHSKNSALVGDSNSKHRRSVTSQKGRGNFLRKACFALLAAYLFSAADVFAQQQRGDMSAGVNVNIILPGIGAKYRYAINENFRLEGCFNWFIEKKAENQLLTAISDSEGEDIKRWDATLNTHWFFGRSNSLYFIAGGGIVHKNVVSSEVGLFDDENDIVPGFRPALNIGLGWDIRLGENLALNIEVKSRWLGLLSTGLVYKF